MKLGIYGARIGAAAVAADFLRWEIAFMQESGKDQQTVLSRHFPQVPLYSDTLPNKQIDVFSIYTVGPPRHIHGREPTLDTDYLELALQSAFFASCLSSRWLVLETNPRLLRTNKGKDFARVLHEMGKFGYGFAYRVLDSQYFGIPQSRRSLFIVGYLGDYRPPASVLFQSLSAREYRQEDRQKSFIIRTPEEVDSSLPAVLPYKVAHQTNLYYRVPRLPHLKEDDEGGSHIPFMLLHEGVARNFTPVEAERLQGFSEGYTATFPLKRRLSVICNSGCVPHYLWLLSRIERVHGLLIE